MKRLIPLDLKQLATFRAVARHLSFTRAAAELGYAQSSVTAQIQALEIDLDVSLFDRVGRAVVLTDAGRRLGTYAESILALSLEALDAVTGSKRIEGSLAVSAPEALLTYRLPRIIGAFHSDYPDVHLTVCSSDERGLEVPLLGNAPGQSADVAFVLSAPIRSAALEVQTLIAEDLTLIVPTGHRLRKISAADVAGLVQRETVFRTCNYETSHERLVAAAGFYEGRTTMLSSLEAVKQCVAAGIGVAVVPAFTVAGEVERGLLRALNIDRLVPRASTQIVRHKARWVSPAVGAFWATTCAMLGAPPG